MAALATDNIFILALQTNEDLMDALGYIAPTETTEGEPARLYGTAIPLPDEDEDNVPVPYVIVTLDGLNNDQGTKDDRYESPEDTVTIGVTVAAKTLDDLHDLTQEVRQTILGYMRNTETPIMEYQFAAQAIQYDSMKPCYWQVLTYQCIVDND